MSKTRVSAALLILVLAVGLTACAKEAQPTPSAPLDVESPTPQPAETVPEEPESVPERLFGGDCNSLLTATDVSALVGVPVILHPADTGLAYRAVDQLGGIHCVWSESEAVGDVAVSMILLPPSVPSEERMSNQCEAGWGCSFSRAFGGANAFGVLVDAATSPERNKSVAESLLGVIAPAIDGADAPEPWIVARPWSIPIDCSTLTGSGVIGEILGESGLVGNQYGGDAEPNSGWYAAYFAAGVVRCTWDQNRSGVIVSAEYLSGGSWAEMDISELESAVPVAIEGVESAISVGQDLHLFDGDNWLILNIPEGAVTNDQRSAIAQALVGEMNTRG